MGETENTEISDESEPTEEQTEEEENEEEIILEEGDSEEGEVTDEKPADQQEEQPSGTETETEEIETEEPEVEETVEDAPALTTLDSEVDSLVTPAETKILIKGVTKNNEGQDELADLSTADVYFTNGCASDDGATVRDNVDITFRVLAKEGSEVTGVTYAADASEDNLTLAKATSTAALGDDGVWTIGKNAFTTNNKNDKSVLIVVKTAEIKYTVKTGSLAAGVAVNTVKTEGTTTTLEAVPSAGVEYDYSKANAITLAMTGMAADKTYIVEAKAGRSGELKPLTAGAKATAGETEYIPYTLNVSELDGVDKENAQEITVTVREDSAVTVTASPIEKTTGYDGAIAAAVIPAEGATGYVAYTPNGKYTAGDKVAFTITPAANSKWAAVKKADITAELTNGKDDEKIEIAAASIEENPSAITKAEGTTVYAVPIPADVKAGYTLHISVNAELDAEKSTTITFEKTGNPAKDQVVTIKGGEAADATTLITAASIKTMVPTYHLDIASREGYQLQDVSVKVSGNYSDTNKTAYEDTYTLDEAENYGSKDHPEVESKYPRYRVKKEIALSGSGTGDHAGQTWTAKTVTVTVNVAEAIEGADEEKQVTFESTAATYGNPYTFEVKTSKGENDKDLVKYEEVEGSKGMRGKATIAEGVQYLQFSVAAETKPEVKLMLTEGSAAETEGLLETVSEAAGKFEYRVAAKALIGAEGHISITRQPVDFIAEIPGSVARVTYKNTENEKNQPQTGTLTANGTRTVDINAPLDVTVEPISDVPIKSVTYKVGEKGAAQTAPVDSEGNYFFQVKAADDVKVTVERVEDERLFVTDPDDPEYEMEVAPDSVVEANYENTIKAYLLNADNEYISIIRAAVYDGTTLAETKAVVENDEASFKVEKNEYEKELTVELMKADRSTVSFKVKSDKAVEGDITYTDNNGETVTAASLNADTRLTLHVSAKEGTVGKLKAAVVPAAETVPEKVPDTIPENANVSLLSPYLSDGTITIIASALKDKVDDAGLILVYDQYDADKKVLSSLKVSVKAPIMKGQTASAEKGLSDGRTVSIKINVPDEVKSESLQAGILGYEIKVTAPDGLASMAKPDASWTDAEWNATRQNAVANLAEYATGQFKTLSQIQNGFTLRVIDEKVTDPITGTVTVIKPAKIAGIKISVTPVQYTAGKRNPADRTDANKISGTPSADIVMDTTAPIYSDTLKLGKGASSLTTGQDADIVVAEPEFAKDAQYKSVRVDIIDSTTGMPHDEAWAFEDDARWNPADGTVTVNAKNASYANNARGEYKNLAVKVTAFTEDGDYGVSGVKKLSVINGIEDMELTVQPEILFTGRKVTAKSAINYNTDSYGSDAAVNKKMAPKKKAATYRIVGADSYIDYNYDLYEAPVSANLSAAVDAKGTPAVSVNAKNGQITVAAAFAFGKNNTFQVLAESADYAGNPVKTLSGPITIIGEDTTLGELAVFEKGTKGWSNAKKVTGSLQVKSTSGQYRLAMLKPGMADKPNGYNLSSETMGYSLFDVKSSNKSITVDPDDGEITVKKLGKTSFTMAAKSNTKNKKELRNVDFVMEDTELYVELKRYQDSTFKHTINTDTKYYNANATIDITGNTTGYFSANIVKKKDAAKEIASNNCERFALPNYTFSFKNAKKVTPVKTSYGEYSDDAYFVATGSTGAKATVLTVNNKGVKPAQKFTVTITNATAPAGNAPKLAVADKKQRIVADYRYNEIPVNITTAKKGEILPADTYVMLSADQTKKTKANVNNVFDGFLDTPIRLDRTGDSTARFTVGLRTGQAESYTLIATLGTLQDGVFTQTHKEARITLKAVKANYTIKATSKYTLNPYGASSAKLVITGGDNDVMFDGYKESYYDSDNGEYKITPNVNYAKNVIQKDGTPNEFNKYFVVTADIQKGWDDYYDCPREYAVIDRIMINPALTSTELKNLEDKDFVKNNTTGYITVTNGCKTVDVKLTITVKQQKDMKPKAVVTPVIEGKDVITDIQITDGKKPLALAAYSADGTSFKAYYTTELASNAAEKAAEEARLANGIIRMKAAEAKKGNDPITLKVLLADTVDAYRVQNNTTNPDPMKNGVDITGVKVTIAANTTANKVVVAKNDQKWVVKRTDWNTWPTEGGTFYGWHTDVNYSFKNRLSAPAGQTIEVKSDTSYVDFGTEPYSVDGKGVLSIDLDKEKLTAAVNAPKSKVNWGKSVKVKATFTYPGTAEEGKEAPELFKSDVVTFTITLPEKEGFESADALKTAVDTNRAALQNFVDAKTAEEHSSAMGNANDDYTPEEAAKYVAEMLRDEVLDMAKGTTAEVKTTGTYSSGVYTYTLSIGTTKVDPFVVRAVTPTAETIANLINTRYGSLVESVADDKDTAKTLGLTLNPKTQAGDLTAKLRKILDNEHYMTRNISLSVSDITYGKIDTTVGGAMTATVVVRDSNAEPHYAGGDVNHYEQTATVRYTFNQLDPVTDFADKTELANALNGNNDDSVKNIVQIFSDAYIASSGDIDMTTHKIGDTMRSKLTDGIVKFAGEQIGNPYLSVKEIVADSLKCEWNSNKWTLAFKMNYTDETPGTKKPEIPVEITAGDSVEVLADSVASFQNPAQLQTAVEAVDGVFAKAHYLIKNVATPADAEAAVTELIMSASINPTYKAADSLSVQVASPEADNFTAPTADTNGLVNVHVIYNNDTENKDQTGDYTFVIVKNDNLLGDTTTGEGEEEVTTPNLNDHDKAVDLVKAALTADKLNTIVKDAWENYAATVGSTLEGFTADKIKAGVVEKVNAALTVGKITTVKEVAEADIEVAAITLPTDSTKTGTIGAVTVKLQDKSPAAEATDWTAENPKAVATTQVTLTADSVFESEDKFVADVKAALAAGIDYKASYFDTDGTVKESEIDNIVGDVNTLVAAMKSDNPLRNLAAFTKEAAKAETASDDHETAVTDPGEGTVKVTGLTDVKLTLGEKTYFVPVTLLKEDEMSLVKGVTITDIGSQKVTGDHSTEDKVLVITGDGSEGLALKASVDMTTGANGVEPEVEWTLATKGDTDSDMTNATAGVKKINIDAKNNLVIPDDAYADGTDEDVVLKLTAKAKDAHTTGTGKDAATIFIKINLKEDVTGIKLTNKDAVDDDTTVLTTFEAPAAGGGNVTYTFKAVPDGKHVKADTKAVFDEVTIEGDDNVTVERQTATDEMLLTVKPEAKDHDITLVAKVDGYTTAALDKNTITIKANGTAKDETTLSLGNVTGEAAYVKATATDPANRLTVTNATAKAVEIPINFEKASGKADRTWNTTTIAVETAGQEFSEIAETNPEIEVKEGEGADAGKFFLVVNNNMPKIDVKQEAGTNGTPAAIEPLVLKLTAASDAVPEKGQAAVTVDLTFEIVVTRTITGVKVAHDDEAGDSANVELKDDGVLEVTKSGATDVTLKATVEGAHVNGTTDQEVTWKITSQGAKSDAVMDGNVLKIPTTGTDNIIKVQAASTVDGTKKGTITIRVK